MSDSSKNLKVDRIETDHGVENGEDLQDSLKHHGIMARMGGLFPSGDEPIEINLKDLKVNPDGKTILTIETKIIKEKHE